MSLDRLTLLRTVAARWLHPWFLLATLTFAVGAAIGAGTMALASPEAVADAAAAFGNPNLLPDRLTTWTIFTNNVVALAVVAAGAVSFGAAAALALLFNGILLGAVVILASGETGLLVLFVFIIPHGVFELPALFLVGGVTYRLTWQLVSYLRGSGDPPTRQDVGEAAALVAAAVALLAVAAFVEANLTPAIGRAVAG